MIAVLCASAASSNPAVLASKDVPVFFISINGSERLRRFRSTFSAFSVVQHVPAVTNATTADWMVHFDQYRRLLTRNTPSELGCALSHVSAIAAAERHCARRGCEMAIVVEDDASDDLLPATCSAGASSTATRAARRSPTPSSGRCSRCRAEEADRRS